MEKKTKTKKKKKKIKGFSQEVSQRERGRIGGDLGGEGGTSAIVCVRFSNFILIFLPLRSYPLPL